MSLKVYQALVNSFIEANFGLPVAHQNIDFVPQQGQAYAAVYIAENDVTPLTLDDVDETDGIFRIILRFPQNTGGVQPEIVSERIRTYYHIGKKLEYDGQLVTVRSYSQSPGEADDGWYKLVLTIRYKAYLNRFNH